MSSRMSPFDHDLTPETTFDSEYWRPEVRPQLAAFLRAVVAGDVTVSGDDGYDQARQAWHVVVDQHPAAIVHVRDADDVAATVKVARDLGVAVSPQPGGHGATGRGSSTVDGSILLRTGALDEVTVNQFGRRLRVGAGVKWGRALADLKGTGLLALAGSSADTTVVGYSVGGGLSWFSRRHGYAAHSVHALEIVDAHGEHQRVTADDDPDLFWALRGGGGDFGVVTALEANLHAAPTLYGGSLVFPGSELDRVWHAYVDVTSQAPDELSVWLRVMNLPDLPFVPEPMRGAVTISVYFTYVGDPEKAERLIARIRRTATPIAENVRPFPISQLGAIADEPEDPVPAALGGLLLDDIGPQVRELAKATVFEPGSPVNMMAFRHLGGALARPSIDDGAAGTVDQPYQLMLGGVAPSVELLAPVQARIDRFVHDLRGHHDGRSVYNFSDRTDPSDSLPDTTLARLRAIKRERDPEGVIRGNRPVLGTPTQVIPDDLTGI